MRIQNIIFVVTVGVLLMPGRETFVWAQATDVVCTGCVASTDIADLGVTSADLATGAVSSVKIADGAILNADVSAAAAIAGTKVVPNFGAQNILTTGKAGIGTASPQSELHVHNPAFSWSILRLTNSGTGATGSDGLKVSMLDATSAEIWNSENGFLRFGTAYGEVMRLTSAGTIGLGTTTPASRLDMAGALTVRGMAAPATAPAGQGRLYYDSTTNKFKVSQNGAAFVDLLGGGGISQWAASGANISYATGNVGIGTTAPIMPLDVQGNAMVRGALYISLSQAVTLGSQTGADLSIYASGATGAIGLGTNGDRNRLVVASTGNVGIGTTSPGASLHISKGVAALRLTDTSGPSSDWSIKQRIRINGDIGFYDNTNSAYRLYIAETGSVGIGTTAPTAPLHSKLLDQGVPTTADIISKASLRLSGGTGLHSSQLLFGSAGGANNTYWIQAGKNAAAGDTPELLSGYGLLLQPLGGNVGIGTTSPGAKLDIEGNLQMYTGGPWFYMLSQNSKNISLATVGGGIAIDQAGNVGIGTTSPGAKLDVNGTLNAHNAMTVQAGAGNIVGGLSWASADNGQLYLNNGGATTINIMGSGNTYFNGGSVGIGTTDPGVYKLAVKGKIHAEEVVVDTGWADFVFKKDYKLMPLEKVAKHIEEAGHLPGIPSEQEVRENGISIGQIQSKLLQKIEEMTLYVIDLKKENDQLKERISSLEKWSR